MFLGGRYQLLSAPLSTGSFGSVFVAEDTRMPRRVAVKILHPQHAESPTVRARFRRELEAACRVQHENVVSVFDIGEDDNLGLYYVMELVRGTPLKDYLNCEPMPWPFVYRVGMQLARALHAIHAADIVHRDLKPQNIMLVERSSLEELVKVLDFGIASLKTQNEDLGDVELTGARMVLGTPPYMSPEQTYMRSDRDRLDLTVDARSDLYSLGVILYELAAGRRPFNGDAHDIVVAHRLTKPMPLDRMVGVSVPPEFADLVMDCLAKDPKDRPQSARDFLQSLRNCEDKAVRVWAPSTDDTPPADLQELGTMMEAEGIPYTEALPSDTRPRLNTVKAAGSRERGSTRGLWAPLAGAAAILALIALALIPSSANESPRNRAPIANARNGALNAGAGRSAPLSGTDRVAPVPVQAGQGTQPVRTTVPPGQTPPAATPAATAQPPVPSTAPVPSPRVATGTPANPTLGLPNPSTAGVAPAVPLRAPPKTVTPTPTVDPEGNPPESTRVIRPAPTAPKVIDADIPVIVNVQVTTTPSGATVKFGGRSKGQTPLTLPFSAPDDRTIRVMLSKRGYKDKSIILVLGPAMSGKVLVINERLQRG
ncbi:MAG: serine/threonine protein kinase, partial [Myxococcota bacterium]